MPAPDAPAIRPARAAEWIARVSAPAAERADLLADLRDELTEHAAKLGAAAARRWYWRQVLRSICSAS